MKAVLMSIHPKWCELIFSGEKTIEVRKTAPKLETPFKVYVYETLGKRTSCRQCAILQTCPLRSPFGCNEGAGAVVGEFVCDQTRDYIPFGLRGYELPSEWLKNMCLSKEQVDRYGGLKTLHGLHITEPKLYDTPKDLSEFRTPDEPFRTVEQANGNTVFMDGYKRGKTLTRAPQSWCYVEEVQGD